MLTNICEAVKIKFEYIIYYELLPSRYCKFSLISIIFTYANLLHSGFVDLKFLLIYLRTFARKFSNIDFFLQILPLKDDELVMSEM